MKYLSGFVTGFLFGGGAVKGSDPNTMALVVVQFV